MCARVSLEATHSRLPRACAVTPPTSFGRVCGMANRDVERITQKDQFIATLRRVADALEQGEAFRVQVQNLRLTVPADAELSVEHEVEGEQEELELQFRWARPKG